MATPENAASAPNPEHLEGSHRTAAPHGRTIWVVTVLLVLMAVANGFFCLLVLPEDDPGTVVAGSAAMAVASPLVLLSRGRPVTVTVALMALAVVLYTVPGAWRELAVEGGLVWPLMAAAWSAANLVATARLTRQFVVGGVALAAFAVSAAAVYLPDGNLILNLLNASAPILGGVSISLFLRLSAVRREKVRQEARERVLLAERARVDERRRLATEMHDVVSHQVSLMVLQAGALGVATSNPEVRAAADGIRSAGSRAIEELRGIIGVLREDPQALREHPDSVNPPEPAPDPLTPVEEARVAGQDVMVTPASVGSGALRGLPPHVARALHRVVQESLTNARKHAPGAPVRLELDQRPDSVRVVATNPAPANVPGSLLAAGGSGIGLEGLRQRVEMLGGAFQAAPADDGGFRVSAVLPVEPVEEHT